MIPPKHSYKLHTHTHTKKAWKTEQKQRIPAKPFYTHQKSCAQQRCNADMSELTCRAVGPSWVSRDADVAAASPWCWCAEVGHKRCCTCWGFTALEVLNMSRTSMSMCHIYVHVSHLCPCDTWMSMCHIYVHVTRQWRCDTSMSMYMDKFSIFQHRVGVYRRKSRLHMIWCIITMMLRLQGMMTYCHLAETCYYWKGKWTFLQERHTHCPMIVSNLGSSNALERMILLMVSSPMMWMIFACLSNDLRGRNKALASISTS